MKANNVKEWGQVDNFLYCREVAILQNKQLLTEHHHSNRICISPEHVNQSLVSPSLNKWFVYIFDSFLQSRTNCYGQCAYHQYYYELNFKQNLWNVQTINAIKQMKILECIYVCSNSFIWSVIWIAFTMVVESHLIISLINELPCFWIGC